MKIEIGVWSTVVKRKKNFKICIGNTNGEKQFNRRQEILKTISKEDMLNIKG